MKTILWRTGSGQIGIPSLGSVSPRTFSGHDSSNGAFFPAKSGASSPRTPLHFEVRDSAHPPVLRRVRSETDLTRPGTADSDAGSGLKRLASSSFLAVPKQRKFGKEVREDIVGVLEEDEGALMIGRLTGMVTEELRFSGGGNGKGGKTGGRNGGGRGGGNRSSNGGEADQGRVGAYYKEMLKANPRNPLLLRNYGKYLHEVEKDASKAEEYYGRAIIESPGDGEVLSLYAKLIWDTHRDEKRAESYFDRAVEASPDDCYVLASYAHFLWDAEEKGDKLEEKTAEASPMIAAC